MNRQAANLDGAAGRILACIGDESASNSPGEIRKHRIRYVES